MEKSKQAKVGNTEDRLHSLPDEILTHILAFLSTKESVRTSILSTRWKSVWASVPTLHLTIDRGELFDFLNRLLMSGSVHFLQKVDIEGSLGRPHEIPQSLFCCKKLVVLKLCGNMVLNFPMTFICFPNLKVLALVSIIYKDDYSAQNMISSCPILEDLTIVRYTDDNLGTLNVTSGSLKNLVVDVAQDYSVPVRKTLIDASALESLYIDDNSMQEYKAVNDFSSITKATLGLVSGYYAREDHKNFEICLFEFLGKISNVKFLNLSRATMWHLLAANSYNLQTFENLTCLEIFDDNDVDLNDSSEWKLLLEFLQRSPVLEVLIFHVWFSWPEEFGTSKWDVPSCLLSHLKTITIMGVMEEHVQMISYFLKNAKVLERMTIDCCSVEDVKLLVNEEVSMSPRGSIACQVEIL